MGSKSTEAFRLSPQQRELWLLQQDSRAYRAQAVIRLDGDLDTEALNRAVKQVVNRHEILRTTFERMQGIRIPFQVVGETSVPSWRGIDWTGRATADEETALSTLLSEERHHVVDLERGPVLRLCLVAFPSRRHLLIVTLPALCADTATMANLAREIGQAYRADGNENELGEVPLQYADFAAWQNELLETADADADAAKSFWEKEASTALPAMKLPFEAEPVSQVRFEPAAVTHVLRDDALGTVDASVSTDDIPGRAFFLAGLHALLWRLTGVSDVSVRNVMPGRKFEETRGAMGLFAKAVPIQSHCEGHFRLSDLVHDIQQQLTEAESWQEYFTNEEATESVEGRELPVNFELVELPPPIDADGLSLRVEDLDSCTAPFKLKLTCVRRSRAWALKFDYNPEVYRRQHVERIAGHLVTLLTSAARNPDARLDQLELLDEAERRELLVTLNETTASYPDGRCLQDLFEEQVGLTPANTAVVFEEHEVSYAALNAKANQLAHALQQRGVAPGVRVGLCLDRSVEMVVGMLGILKAGGAYVPLSPDHPKPRLLHQLTEVEAPLLVTQEKFLGQLPAFSGHMICLDRDRDLLGGQSTSNPDRATTPEHLAYVLYTSGSTGTPKGVAVRHRNLVNYTSFICNKLQLERQTNALQFATVSTITADLGNTVIFPSLVSGGCLHVLGYDVATDADAFATYVSTRPIDVLKIVPSHLKALIAADSGAKVLPRTHLIMGGEALSWDFVDRLVEVGATCRIINHYGPTETTVGSLVFDVGRGDRRRGASRTVPVGRPIANTEVYILDEQLQPVPLGVSGELYIGGLGVAAGYIGRPELTAERFIPHPFSSNAEARLYSTGDIARYLADGNVEFLGRRDHQVKLRGFRVELGEIEATLLAHPAVSEGVVVAHEDASGDKHLVAYFVPVDESRVDRDDLRRFTRERLPDYMVPAAWISLRSLPLTRNGKVDRDRLPAPDQQQPDSERVFEAPRTQVEQTVAALWAQVLKRERVGLHDNFFELGGHSLLVTQVVSRLRNEFQVDLSLRTMFEHPTVAGIALAIAQQHVSRDEQDALGPMLTELEGISDEEAERLLKTELRPND